MKVRRPLFSLSGNRLGSQAQRFFANDPAFCREHGLPQPARRPLPAFMRVAESKATDRPHAIIR